MRFFMPCRTRPQALSGIKETIEKHGGTCIVASYESAEKMRRTLRSSSFDAVIAAESAVLAHVPRTTPTVYACAEYYCADKRLPSDLSAYWIAHEDLAFEFMTRGARDRRVRVCGVPLRAEYRKTETRGYACRSLGVGEDQTVFSVFTDGVSPNEIKSTVRAVRARCPEGLVLLWCGDRSRRGFWQTAFAADTAVFVPETENSMPLSLAAADVVFTPAFTSTVCAAARQDKNIILLHAAAQRARRNAAYFDLHGAAFCGKTAADNVSYALRLLSSDRLRGNMHTAQEKVIVRDAEDRVVRFLEEIAEKRD